MRKKNCAKIRRAFPKSEIKAKSAERNVYSLNFLSVESFTIRLFHRLSFREVKIAELVFVNRSLIDKSFSVLSMLTDLEN